MPIITYNKFYNWISLDDKSYQDWNYLFWENMNSQKTWYWITLWPKTNKRLLTWWKKIFGIWYTSSSYWMAVWEDWVMYDSNSTDNVPSGILSNWQDIYKISSLWAYNFLLISTTTANRYKIAQTLRWGTTEVSLDYLWYSIVSFHNIPMVSIWNNIFIWWDSLTVINSSWFKKNTIQEVSYITWITSNWTTIITYHNTWDIYFWQQDTSISGWTTYKIVSHYKVPFMIKNVIASGWQNYAVWWNNKLYIISWQDFKEIWWALSSLYLDDNSDYKNKITLLYSNNNLLAINWQDLFLAWKDNLDAGKKTIYRYWELFEWIPKWFDNIITKNHNILDYDDIYTLFNDYNNDNNNKILISYKTWTEYWIDYIDIWTNNTTSDWYMITQIENCTTNIYKKKLKEIKIITSNTAWNNYIKIYNRIDWWTWILLRDINNTIDNIQRTIINTSWKEFLDIQFKIELHNDTLWTRPPILHELAFEYETIQ